jgi:hypothetical protein
VICFEKFKKLEKLRKIVMCKHLFHESCLSSWITARIDNPTCPMCNIQFYDDDSDSDEDGE